MSYGPLFVLLFVGFALAVGAVAQIHESQHAPQAVALHANATAQQFVFYRNLVVKYCETHTGFAQTGQASVSASSLDFPPGTGAESLPADAGNLVIGTGSARTVYVWSRYNKGALAWVAKAMQGDVTIGQSENGAWYTPADGWMGTLPAGVPNGDLVSVIGIGK